MTDPRPTLAAPDDDPYLWLEDIEGDRATAWADAQSQATMARLADASFEADRDALRTLMDRPDNLPIPARRGGLLYNFWKDAAHPRGLWRRTTLESFRTQTPAWDILLDMDALATAENADWVWHGAATLPPAHERAIIRLSRGGSDAVILREYDLPTRHFVENGFALEEAKGGVDWLDIDTLLLSSAIGGETRSGYADSVRLWHRGTPWDASPVIFRTDPANMSAWGDYDREAGRLLFAEKTGFYDTTIWFGDRTGPKQRIDLPNDANYSWSATWLAVSGRTGWTAGATTYAPDTVAVIALEAFLAGDRTFTTVFEPAPRRALQSFFWSNGRLILALLDDLRPLYLTLEPGIWTPTPLPGLPETGTVNAWPLDVEDEESDGTLLALTQDPITPPPSSSPAPASQPPRSSSASPPPSTPPV